QLNQYAAGLIAQQLKIKPNLQMGMATGRTPIGLYEQLIKLYKNNSISFKQVSMYNLDEYIGLPKGHKQSFFSFMQQHLFKHIDVEQKNMHIPNGNANDLESECDRYNNLLTSTGQLDIQILGIGKN